MSTLSSGIDLLQRDLRDIFGARLQSLVAYGTHAAGAAAHPDHAHGAGHAGPVEHTMAIVQALSVHDLRACSQRIAGWHDAGLATPLLLAAHEFEDSLDAFPLEFGAIVADHVLIAGTSPFDGLAVNPADVRRACEVQARSHLLHLREGYLETGGNRDALAVLIVQSAAPFAALLHSIARLEGAGSHDAGAVARYAERALNVQGIVTAVVKLTGVTEISADEASRIFPEYLDVVERLVTFVDGWGGAK